ncbi:MAG TPA: DUF2971 domain-containing protein [Dyella sp.]|uniref:DUF2971 domain-containing protein n=1 Tax=Dyella sp. TaxID=1869338 RepID=UPI002F9281E6
MDFEPEEPEEGLLYHYCDAAAFESMIRTNTLWMSPFRHSNDSDEGIRAQKMLIELASKLGLKSDSLESFRGELDAISKLYDCYGLCLSKHGDLLSQWRGYAADGAGFSIGFRQSDLQSLQPYGPPNVQAGFVRGPVLHEVMYQEEDQLRVLTPWFQSMEEHIKRAHIPYTERMNHLVENTSLPDYVWAHLRLHDTLTDTWDRLYTVKSAAFSEEAEWRLVMTAFHFGAVPFKYRSSRGMVVPYIEYILPDRSLPQQTISHVYLGPKNRTPPYVVRMLLNQYDLEDITVKQSVATYR